MRRIKGEYYTQEDQYTSQDGQIPNVRVYNLTESNRFNLYPGGCVWSFSAGFFSFLAPVAEILMLMLKLADHVGDAEILTC